MLRCIKMLADAGVPLRDIAILYRAHHISRTFEEVFLKEEIPYTIFSGVQFFNRMEIKDALSYLRLVAYPGRSFLFARGERAEA